MRHQIELQRSRKADDYVTQETGYESGSMLQGCQYLETKLEVHA